MTLEVIRITAHNCADMKENRQIIGLACDSKMAINLCDERFFIDSRVILQFPNAKPRNDRIFSQINFADAEFVAAIDTIVTHNIRQIFSVAVARGINTAIEQIMQKPGKEVCKIGLCAYFGLRSTIVPPVAPIETVDAEPSCANVLSFRRIADALVMSKP